MPSGCYRTSNENVGKNPQLAIDFVTGKTNPERLQGNFSDGLYYSGKGDSIFIPNDTDPGFAWPNLSNRMAWGGTRVALLMNGTTDELKRMLHIARNEGIEGVEASNDYILVWYLRRKAGTETKSLVLIAPKVNFLGANNDDPATNYNYKTKMTAGGSWEFRDLTPGSPYTGSSLSVSSREKE